MSRSDAQNVFDSNSVHPENTEKPNVQHSRSTIWLKKLNSFIFWLSALAVLIIAVCIAIGGVTTFKGFVSRVRLLSLKIRLRALGFSDIINGIFGFQKGLSAVEAGFPYEVLWMAPFLSSGGYSSEAWAYVTALEASKAIPKLKILQHGDLENLDFWNGLPKHMKAVALKRYVREIRDLNETVVICHSEPGAWYPPLFETVPCPPFGYKNTMYVIGRTMFETDRVDSEHVRRCNLMDSVWVPSDFHVRTFIESGVSPSKVVKMVQSVDVEFFDPKKWKPLPLSLFTPLFGPKRVEYLSSDVFVFLSIFKWELRKGWDVLLKAFLEEFSAKDNAALCIQTNAFHNDENFGDTIRNYMKECGLTEPPEGWAAVYISDKHLPQNDLPRLYKAASAFALPSRGEGWGRPNVEAMAMSLPVITTNWSGPTEYLSDENGYPLPLSGMSKVSQGPFAGHFWAEPSVHHLRFLMRHVFSNPLEAKRKGLRARLDMLEKYSPRVVAKKVVRQLSQIIQSALH